MGIVIILSYYIVEAGASESPCSEALLAMLRRFDGVGLQEVHGFRV